MLSFGQMRQLGNCVQRPVSSSRRRPVTSDGDSRRDFFAYGWSQRKG